MKRARIKSITQAHVILKFENYIWRFVIQSLLEIIEREYTKYIESLSLKSVPFVQIVNSASLYFFACARMCVYARGYYNFFFSYAPRCYHNFHSYISSLSLFFSYPLAVNLSQSGIGACAHFIKKHPV